MCNCHMQVQNVFTVTYSFSITDQLYMHIQYRKLSVSWKLVHEIKTCVTNHNEACKFKSSYKRHCLTSLVLIPYLYEILIIEPKKFNNC